MILELRALLLNFLEKFINNNSLVKLVVSVIMVIFWIILGNLVIKTVKLLVLRTSSFSEKQSKQGITIRRLINNVIKALFLFWITLMILREIGIDIIPVLAGAGVFAFAVGFGAQELIKDLISGFFLILEKTFSIGDYVQIGSNSGTITDIGLRRIKMENWRGEVITINNGDIKTVINSSLNKSVAAIDFSVNIASDIRHFEDVSFTNFVKEFAKSEEDVLDLGSSAVVTDLSNGVITIRITFKTNTRKHVGIERSFRKELVKYVNDNNLDLKLPIYVENE